MRIVHMAGLVLLGVVLCGCSMHKKIPIPEHVAKNPIIVQSGEKMAPVLFERLMVSIKRGNTIGSYHTDSPEGHAGFCNRQRGGPITWSGDRLNLGGVYNEAGNTFHRTLSGYGYDVVGNPDMVFGADKDLSRAKYKVAAVVTDLKTNICRYHDFWYGMPQGTDQGEMWLEVKWMVYSTLHEKIITEFRTTGYFKYVELKPDGFDYLFIEAFSSACDQLAASGKFHDLLAGKLEAETAKPMGSVGDLVSLPRVEGFKQPFGDQPDRVTSSVVSLRLADWHGSGFIVSEQGHILTNAHVVGGADTVNVRLAGGFEVPGKVLKVHESRDVALVKVDITHAKALPIRKNPVKVTETVYAIGAPYDLNLSTTVSRGVVSALRSDDKTGYPMIQGDVGIHGGNSGGPLVDADGNVVGICVAGIMANAQNKIGSGLNFFIPINDALKKLNIVMAH